MAVVSDRDFDVIGEWYTVGVLRDNIFALLCLTSTAPIYHSLMLYHQWVMPLIMWEKNASFLFPLAGYVNSLLP